MQRANLSEEDRKTLEGYIRSREKLMKETYGQVVQELSSGCYNLTLETPSGFSVTLKGHGNFSEDQN